MNRTEFALSYQKSPIILTNGIATNLPDGKLPLISLTQAHSYATGVLSSASDLRLNDMLFDFYPLPGATLIDNQIATYPFANQSVAANAIITQPLHVALLMEAPARGNGAYDRKLSVFQSLKKSLEQHNASGGTYTVVTPSYLYTDCILLSLRDAGSGDPKRPQDRWQWEFVQPLLTLEAARQAENALVQKLTSGAKVTPNANGEISYSGQAPSVGNPASGTGASLIPAAQSLTGTSVGARQQNKTGAN